MAIHGTIKSARVAADGIAYTGKGYFYGITVSTAAGAIVVYDNTAASGTQLMQANAMGNYFIDPPIPFTIGIYVDITSNVAIVYYAEAP